MVMPMIDVTLDTGEAAAIKVNLRLATMAVVKVDLTSGTLAAGTLEVHLRLAA